MSDFVAEIRPRTFAPKTCTPTQVPGDFVAEIRPRILPPKTYTSTNVRDDFVAEIRPRRSSPPDVRYENIGCQALDVSDHDLQNIISESNLSREGFTGLLERSILTLVEKLLTGRSLSKMEGLLCITLSSQESPIILNFSQRFPSLASRNGVSDQSLENSFNIKMKNDNFATPSCHTHEQSLTAKSPLHGLEKEACHTMNETEGGLSVLPEPQIESNSPLSISPCGFHNISPSTSPRKHEVTETQSSNPKSPSSNSPGTQSPSSNSPGTQSPSSENKLEKRQESDDESGYTSNEKEDSETSCGHSDCTTSCTRSPKPFNIFNDYYCNGFDGENTLYTSDERKTSTTSCSRTCQNSSGASRDGSDETDEIEDIDLEHSLIIDEGTSQEPGNRSEIKESHEQAMDVDMEDSACIKETTMYGKRRPLYHKAGLNYETEDSSYPVSSDITDTDVPVDFSGDSKSTLDVVLAMPHPQSLVSKHPGGFRCKQCSQILADATAVTEHVQSHHDLFCCTICCRTFTAKNNLKRHNRIHTGHRPYKCTQCSLSFARRDDLKMHMLRHDYSKPFRCSVCKKGYTDRACVKNHMAKEHRSRLMHVCPQCGESYDQEDAFAAHKKTHPELQQFSCTSCSFIGTNNLMTKKHSLLHSYKLFGCKPCNAYFADPFDYTNHIRKHKKTSSFSQYLCCFCDITLSTYDQYIRHEYSHAQGKTHACTTCKKLFKNKTLLQDHVAIHQEFAPDEVQTPVICHQSPVTSENHESKTMLWQDSDVQDTTCLRPSITEAHSNLSGDSESRSSSAPRAEEAVVEFEGQLLDLSMKKPHNINLSISCQQEDHCSSSSRLASAGIRDQNFPRNGVVVSESSYLGEVLQASDGSPMAYKRLESNSAEVSRCNSMENNSIESSMNTETDNSCSNNGQTSLGSFSPSKNVTVSYLHAMPACLTRTRSDEWTKVVGDPSSDKPDHRQLIRTMSQERAMSQEHAKRATFRFSPYSRDKLADIAAKFVAARGMGIIQQRAPVKPVDPTLEHRKGTIILREATDWTINAGDLVNLNSGKWQLDSGMKHKIGFGNNEKLVLSSLHSKENSSVANRASNENEVVPREELNPETALRFHAQILVKSEPVLDSIPEDAAEGWLQKGRDVGARNDIVRMNTTNVHSGTSFGCEDCKEIFASFSELENHSVEMHKRFLCEHCMKSFTARPNRDRHVRYHTGERPYKCDLCDMAFFRGDDLKYHRTTRHPTAQPFICTRCSASFTWSRDLDRHIRHSKCQP